MNGLHWQADCLCGCERCSAQVSCRPEVSGPATVCKRTTYTYATCMRRSKTLSTDGYERGLTGWAWARTPRRPPPPGPPPDCAPAAACRNRCQAPGCAARPRTPGGPAASAALVLCRVCMPVLQSQACQRRALLLAAGRRLATICWTALHAGAASELVTRQTAAPKCTAVMSRQLQCAMCQAASEPTRLL